MTNRAGRGEIASGSGRLDVEERSPDQLSNRALLQRACLYCGCPSCRVAQPCPTAGIMYGFAAAVRDQALEKKP